MIAIKKQEVTYSVQNTNETLKLEGRFSLDENKRIMSFGGNITNIESGNYLGAFSYSEDNNHKMNKYVNDLDVDEFQAIDNFVDTSILELKQAIEEL